MHEYGAPEQIKPTSLGDYLEVMSKSVFQSGMSWKVVDAKWPGIRDGFRGFDVPSILRMGERDIDKLAQNPEVIRNRRKPDAVVENAHRMVELEAEHGSFRDYLHSHGSFEATVADLRKQFRFLGETGSYIFLYIVGEQVPPHEEWEASRKGK